MKKNTLEVGINPRVYYLYICSVRPSRHCELFITDLGYNYDTLRGLTSILISLNAWSRLCNQTLWHTYVVCTVLGVKGKSGEVA